LVTSREKLHLRGEQEIAVPPLALPDPGQLPPVERLSQYAAIALFRERVQASQPSFQVTNANAPAVAKICVRWTDYRWQSNWRRRGLKLFPPEALLARLSSRLVLLTGGARDLPADSRRCGTRSPGATICSTRRNRRCSGGGVFVGGCTIEAAEAVCNANAICRWMSSMGWPRWWTRAS